MANHVILLIWKLLSHKMGYSGRSTVFPHRLRDRFRLISVLMEIIMRMIEINNGKNAFCFVTGYG